MPGNTVDINGGWQEWVVGDSKMDELAEWLKKNGVLTGGRSLEPK